ncbi:hypothetical protein K388_05849 [Streptomyces sp. KhCrAH-43]|uniref:hypothetical protein n=1 Tax=unclassified Streptomyces TaxID=2593676 RepID=UPI000DC526AD|nr:MULTISPECIES: hypothetical protein [unclassified Streptomyces]RAJ52750.1 hypothetical protein K388_05849 [Streptomyces sp. KhCrAH-43]
MPEAHPAHADLPALYRAEAAVFRRRWTMSVIGPDLDVTVGPNVDLGPAEEPTTAQPGDPGRHLISVSGRVPILPRERAVQVLESHGYVVEATAREDVRTDHGWTQTSMSQWTAPCQPMHEQTA